MAKHRSSLARAGMLATLALALSGCAGLNPGTEAAVQAVQQFQDELSAGNAGQACALLAPNAVEGLEEGEVGSCARKLAALALPEPGPVNDSRAYGSSAQVLLENDTVFLVRSGDAWKISAAGCTQRGERPYDCDVKGD